MEKRDQELKIYQEELIRVMELAEQDERVKQSFLPNMSDEIRTPINGIIGNARLLKKTALTIEQWEMVNLLEISSNSLLGVINDVLGLSKIESEKFKINRTPTDIAKLCETVVNLMRIPCVEKELNLTIELDPDLPKMIFADSFRLNQILVTLIGNAIKFTNEGDVTLKVEILDTKENNVQLKFSVNDSGIGIAKENIEKILGQADEQTTFALGETGLRLSFIKTLAKLKGGLLEVQSKEFKGSTFCFTNWYEISEEIEVNKKLMEERLTPLNNIKILVAEDNPINKFLIIKILQNWQVEMDVVENGKEAIDKLREKDYNIILMDTFMPVMNGLEAIKLIREGYAAGKENIPIITFSAAVMDTDKESAIAAGANDVISKPLDPAALHKKILEYTTG
jgi:CheY-like chemotaxis protein